MAMERKSVARIVVREPGTGTMSAPPLAAPEAAAWARGLLDGGWAAVFLPGEPARLGRVLLWQPAGAVAEDNGMRPGVETDSAELVLPHGRSAPTPSGTHCWMPSRPVPGGRAGAGGAAPAAPPHTHPR
ncbi:hypothetical protein ACFXKT_36825, partial [Streptomyces mirabilis]